MVPAPPSSRPAGAAAYHRDVLDRRDLEILGVLQRDGRATYAEIAKQVGLSPVLYALMSLVILATIAVAVAYLSLGLLRRR